MEALFLTPISEASWPNARFLLPGLERPNTPMPDRVFADSRPRQSATVYRAAPLAADRRSRQLKQFHRGTLTLAPMIGLRAKSVHPSPRDQNAIASATPFPTGTFKRRKPAE